MAPKRDILKGLKLYLIFFIFRYELAFRHAQYHTNRKNTQA